ncbi:substrate-binding domain-containing protein [Herbivorax sp. ANBcel31]|uniref:ATP-binding protein n=1 Tax=Herbivorax sp. ANBcel31 TaxID=3069754 RepID=UPI0027B8025C|nr:substrate-binding domain-containing protein [Herbivorax sp. ANBcel31]MDQ2087813.1 substrate-binding domain-containing protein [Herbivorax sp. ANBcel31]
MSKRKTIGFMIDDISGSYQAPIWLKLKEQAEKMNCNLIAFKGKRLGRETQFSSERQHNFIYKLMDNPHLDGLIILSGPQINYIGINKFIDYCKKNINIPLVSIGIDIPNALNLLIDGKAGIKSLVNHLITDHSYQKIGFLRGPETNSEANERFQTYLNVLEENDIPVDKNLIFNGDFEYESGYKIANYILVNNVDLDVLVCANDNMAAGVMNALKNLNSNHDNSFFVTGFDDSPILKKYNYPLTTVRQPYDEIIDSALNYIVNENIFLEKTIYFPAKVVLRNSCGCSSNSSFQDNLSINPNENINVEYKIHELLQTNTVDELFEKVSSLLKLFEIQSCYIVKYSDGPIINHSDNINLSKTSELIYAYDNEKRLEITDDIKYFNTLNILPKELINKQSQYTHLVQPLFFNNEQYGYIVFHVVNNDVTSYDLLRGNIINTLRIASLIQENNEKQSKLLRSEKLAALGEISRGLVNVVKNPANKIVSDIKAINELLDNVKIKKTFPSSCIDVFECIENILISGRESSKNIVNISNSFKKQTLHMIMDSTQVFNMTDIVDELSFLDNPNNCQFDVSNDFEDQLETDYNKLNFIVSSIVQNAIYAYNDISGKIELSISSNNNNLLILIKDYAGGIPEKIKNQIFKKCFIDGENENGIGIGLFVSHIFTKDYFYGDINFETEDGKGTVFEISIPLKWIKKHS